MGDRLPPLLTVEEAAKVLRIGRTKAYALAQEWRTTGGASGLPVVDFGHVLRVPLCQLEQLVGGELTVPTEAAAAESPAAVEPVSTGHSVGVVSTGQPEGTSRPSAPRPRTTSRSRNRHNPNHAQLSLIPND